MYIYMYVYSFLGGYIGLFFWLHCFSNAAYGHEMCNTYENSIHISFCDNINFDRKVVTKKKTASRRQRN